MDPSLSEEQGARNYWTKCLKARLVLTDGTPVSAICKETTDHARHALSVELKAVRDLTTLIIGHVNDLSVTARLPSEILSHLFSILSDYDSPSSRPLLHTGLKLYLGWITVTHVCRRWRQAALSTPDLWTKIGAPQTGPWMNEMLARSKQAPFTLVACIAHDHKVCDVALKAIGPEHIWRLKGIHLIDRTPSRIQGGPLGSRRIEVLASFKQPAPMLESVTLEGITKSDEALPQDIFALTLPHLRCFSFRDFRTMVWEAPYLCNLTDLELGFQANVPLSKLLALLKKSPTLENLKISRRSHSVGTPEAHPPDRGVILLSLETLYYSGPPDPTCIDFLASLTISSAAQVHFSFWGGEVEKMLPIIPLVTAFLGTKDPRTRPSPSRILLSYDQFPDGSVYVGLKTWLKEDSSSSRQPPFSIAWNPHNFMPIAHVPFVQQLLGSFDLRTVTHLMLESQYPDSAIYDTLKDMFRSMPVVREITLNGYGIVPLLGLLETMHVVRPDPEIPDIGGQVRVAESSLFFPGLAYLTVVAAPFDRGRPGDRDWDPLLGVGNALLSLVQKRSAMGARIRTLSITECCGSEAMADSFREHVEILLHRRHRLAGA